MGYSSVRGGLDAIEHAERLIHNQVTEGGDILEVSQVADHLQLITDQVMGEGGVYDVELGALAVKQAEGDPIEAAFLLRAYRTTLPRVGYSLASSGRELRITRRISSAFRDIPGGQVLGRTRDYTQRLMDFSLLDGGEPMPLGPIAQADAPDDDEFPLVIDVLRAQELMPAAPERPADIEPFDVTREPLRFPATRSARLQGLARAETGALLSIFTVDSLSSGARATSIDPAGEETISVIKSSRLRAPEPRRAQPAKAGTMRLSRMAIRRPRTISASESPASSMNLTSNSSSPSAAAPARTSRARVYSSAYSGGMAVSFSPPFPSGSQALPVSTLIMPLKALPVPIGMVT
ncbi:MAG: hypothetical protein CVU47_11545, partial [Chloroflexi bacterium HGW-Chloroflexi-9]